MGPIRPGPCSMIHQYHTIIIHFVVFFYLASHFVRTCLWFSLFCFPVCILVISFVNSIMAFMQHLTGLSRHSGKRLQYGFLIVRRFLSHDVSGPSKNGKTKSFSERHTTWLFFFQLKRACLRILLCTVLTARLVVSGAMSNSPLCETITPSSSTHSVRSRACEGAR
jgi:hypothetical protein